MYLISLYKGKNESLNRHEKVFLNLKVVQAHICWIPQDVSSLYTLFVKYFAFSRDCAIFLYHQKHVMLPKSHIG